MADPKEPEQQKPEQQEPKKPLKERLVDLWHKLTPHHVMRHVDWRVQEALGDLSNPENTQGPKVLEWFQKIKTVPAYLHLRAAAVTPLPDEPASYTEDWHFVKKNNSKVAPEALTEQHPIIYFGGSGQAADFRYFEGVFQEIRQLVEHKELPDLAKTMNAKLIAFGYQGSSKTQETVDECEKRHKAEITRLNANPEYAGTEAQHFTEKYLLPKVFANVGKLEDGTLDRDASGKVKVSGKLPAEQLENNLRMTMIGDSYGGAFIRQSMNALSDYMLKNGYSKDEAHNGIRNIYVHSTGNAAPFKREKPCVTAIRTIHVADVPAWFEVNTLGYYPDKQQLKDKRVGNNPMIMDIAPNERLYWIDSKETRKDKEGNDKGFHFAYINKNIPADAVQALQYAVLTSDPLPDLKEMVAFDAAQYKPREVFGKQQNGRNLYLEHAEEVVRQSETIQQALDALKTEVLAGADGNRDGAFKESKKTMATALVEHFGKGLSKGKAGDIAKIIAAQYIREYDDEAAKRLTPTDLSIAGTGTPGRSGWDRGGQPAE